MLNRMACLMYFTTLMSDESDGATAWPALCADNCRDTRVKRKDNTICFLFIDIVFKNLKKKMD